MVPVMATAAGDGCPDGCQGDKTSGVAMALRTVEMTAMMVSQTPVWMMTMTVATAVTMVLGQGSANVGMATRERHDESRGSGPFVPSIFLFWRAALFFWGECEHQKTDRC